MAKKIKTSSEENTLIAIPYANLQEIIAKLDEVIQYKFNDIMLKSIVNEYSPKYILLTANFNPKYYDFSIAIKGELIAIESNAENSVNLELKIIDIGRIYSDTIRYLAKQIIMVKYSTIRSNDFVSIKSDIEELLLDIHNIQDEHMLNLPLFNPELNDEALEKYTYKLIYLIIVSVSVSTVVKIDSLEDFLNGHALVLLRKARRLLLQYLKIKSQKEQPTIDPIFQTRLLSRKTLPLVSLDSMNKEKLIPLIECCKNISISNSVKNQLMHYQTLLEGKECNIVITSGIDMELPENIGKKHLGNLVSLRGIMASNDKYLLSTIIVSPIKNVMVSAIQKQTNHSKYDTLENTFYCKVENLEYTFCDYNKLQFLIMTSLNIFREYDCSDIYIPSYNHEFITNINYLVNLSNHIIYYINLKEGDFLNLLGIANLEERFTAIKGELLQLNIKERKKIILNTDNKADALIKEESTIPKGFNIIVFVNDIAKYLSLFKSETHSVYSSDLVISKQIEKNYYNNNYNVILSKREITSSVIQESIVPSIIAKINNIKIREDSWSFIDVVPEKRVQVLEIISKDGVFYGRSEEIIEQAPKNSYQFTELKKLVNKLIILYQHKPYINNKVPIFNSSIINLETYAANLSFYIAEQVLSQPYFDTKFFSKTTIEKLSYLIQYIESPPKNQSSDKPTDCAVDTSTFTTSEQWLKWGKSLVIKSLCLQAISSFNNATSLDPTNAEVWYYKASSFRALYFEKNKESIRCYEKAVSLDLDKELLKEAFREIQSHYFYKKPDYQKVLQVSNTLTKLDPDNWYNLYYKARSYFQLEKYQEALNCCDEIIKLKENWPESFILKGHILLKLEKFEESVKCYTTAIDHYLKLETEQKDQFYLNESLICSEIFLSRAIVTDLLGKKTSTFGEYAMVILRLNIELLSCKDINNHLYFLKAMAYSKLGNLKEANECYDKMHFDKFFFKFYTNQEFWQFYYDILNLSNHKNAYFIKGTINRFWQDYREEMKCYEKILELEPDNKHALFFLWAVYDKLGRYQEAADCLEKTIKFNSSYYLEHVLFRDMGRVLCKLEKYDEALDYFNKSLALISEELASKISSSYETEYLNNIKAGILAYYANALGKLAKHQQAIEYFDQALSLDPNHTFTYYNKTQLLSKLQRYDEAVICCTNGLMINPDDSDFLQLKRAILYESCKLSLPEEIQAIEDLINHLPLSMEAKNIATKECNIIKSLSNDSSEKAKHRKYLHNILKLPWGKYDSIHIDLKKASEILDREHYGLQEVKDRILETLTFLPRSDFAKTPIICLVGPPGVGKTSIARSIANALKRKFVSLSLAGSDDNSLIRGFLQTYSDSHPGKILSLITEAGTSNPVILLDEIDKINNTHKGNGLELALLQLLDSEHNSRFTDDYFDFPFDLSKVFFIATANSLDKISFPLINRMEIIELSGYTTAEKMQITNQYLIPKILQEANFTESQLTFDNDIVKHLINHYTKESGVRDIKKLIRTLVQKNLLDEIKGNKPIINEQLIEKYFGSLKYLSSSTDQTARIGTAMGLAYTASGGSTMPIEVEKFPGDGKVKATGKLGEVLKESIETGIAYIKANAAELAISPQVFKEYDLHIHMPEGAVAKDGPSAGITIFVALISLLSNKQVKQNIAMTGELTLKGKILAVGGLKEKLSSAVRDNITTVIIPEANKRDLIKIPNDIKEALIIKTISHLEELLEIVFKDEVTTI